MNASRLFLSVEDNNEVVEKMAVIEIVALEKTKDLSTETLCFDADIEEMETSSIEEYQKISYCDNTSEEDEIRQLSKTQEIIECVEATVTSSNSKTKGVSSEVLKHIYDSPLDLTFESEHKSVSEQLSETHIDVTASSNPITYATDAHVNQVHSHIYDNPPDANSKSPNNKSSTSSSTGSSKNEKIATKTFKKRYNLLIFGEIGAGKSTFINSVPHYLKYKTFKEALNTDKIDCLIPMKFTISSETGEKEICIKVANANTNENFEKDLGLSTTNNQQSKCYIVYVDDETQISFIDTPGFRNNKDQMDLANLKNIQQQIEALNEIYGICFIIPSTTHNLSAEFQNTMKNILSIFTENESTTELPYIYFIFTHSNSTNFNIKSSMAMIRKFVKDYEKTDNIEIPLSDETLYCIDNEAFLMLLAINHEIKFSKDKIKKFEYCWDKSATEIYRFFSTFDIYSESVV